MTTTTLSRITPATPTTVRPKTTVRTIIISPSNRHGSFAVSLDDGRSLTSRQPLLDTARTLLADGEKPNAILEMRWATNPGTCAASCRIGPAGKLSVRENRQAGPVFARYEPFKRFDMEDGE